MLIERNFPSTETEKVLIFFVVTGKKHELCVATVQISSLSDMFVRLLSSMSTPRTGIMYFVR